MQNWIKRVIFCGLLVMAVGGCATVGLTGGIKVAVNTANYTDNYVDYVIYSVAGENLGIGGSGSSFATGGSGGEECCTVIPSPGGTIRVDWKVGDDKVFHSKEIIVSGKVGVLKRRDGFSYLIVRFFPHDEIEAEVIGTNLGPSNLRMDRLFLGIKTMRHKGE